MQTLVKTIGIVHKPRGKNNVLAILIKGIRTLNPLWFLLPALLSMGLWVYSPLIRSVYYSFLEWNMMPASTPVLVGTDNYRLLFTLPDFGRAMLNTLWYILGMIPFAVIIPLVIAIATEGLSTRAKGFYRALFFLPMIMPPVTVATIWRWMLHATNGIFNQALLGIGLIQSPINFLNSETHALLSIILIAGWRTIGFSTLLFSSALTSIDKSYYEAADIDKVSKFRQTITITLPLISPMVIFMLTLNILFTAQWTFVYIDVLTRGGPLGATTNIYYLMYIFGFRNFNVGMSSAAAILFLGIFGAIAIAMTAFNRRFAFYDN